MSPLQRRACHYVDAKSCCFSTDGAVQAEASSAILMITLNQDSGFKLLCLLAGFCSMDHENPPLKDPLTEFSVMVEEGKIKMVERRKKEREIFMA